MKVKDERISRRSFLGRGAASIVGAGLGISGLTACAVAQSTTTAEAESGDEDKPKIKGYRDLGKTGWKVSDFGFGNAMMQEPSLLEYAIERGINYVDTARQYYDMEVVVGKIFPAKRDKVFVSTKLLPELITAEVSVDDITKGIDESLERLNTDYIDCCLIHSVGDPNLGELDRIKNPNVSEAFEKARKAGKIKFWGASAHGPKMIRDFNWLIDNTGIDLIMPGMNLMTRGLEPVLAKAKKKGVAVVAMKSLSAARKIDYSKYMKEGRTVRQALLKWMLAQPDIDTISITMRTYEDVDEYVAISGRPNLTPKEKKALKGYGMLLDCDYCRPGCDHCLHACPHNVPIHDILRYRLYFNNYGREKYAMSLYAGLSEKCNASQCRSCIGPCEALCPHHLAIRSKLTQAHSELMI
ncbi:MAG: aldo/keto reductase [bacterium]|nr:MAG: aldo/keto reductase [bacterium]